MSWLLSPEGGVATLDLVGDVLITNAVKGDILAYDGAQWVDVTVGTNNQVLTADSAIAAGVKWADGGGIDDGTIDFAPLVWDNTNTKWVESASILVQDTTIGTINQIKISGNASSVPTSAVLLLGPSLSENIAFPDDAGNTTGVKLATGFAPSDASHTFDITHYGSPAPTLEPNIQIIGRGEVQFLAGKWIFTATDMTGPGAIGIKEQAATPSGTATIGKLWVKDDTPNILKYTDDAGTEFVVAMEGTLSFISRIGHTYAVVDKVKTPSGQKNFIIPFFVSTSGGQTVKLVKARHRINAGTSVTCKLQKNDVDITGFTGITVTQISTDTDPADVVLADNDKLALVVTAISGVPQNLTFTIFIENTVT